MDKIRLEADLVINLIDLVNERGLPTSFTADDINELISSDIPNAEKLKTLNRVHASLHEVLYSPPRG